MLSSIASEASFDFNTSLMETKFFFNQKLGVNNILKRFGLEALKNMIEIRLIFSHCAL